MAKYSYTNKFVKFKSATGQEIRVSKATQTQLKKLSSKANRLRNKMIRDLYEMDNRRSKVSYDAYKQSVIEQGLVPDVRTRDLTKFRSAKDIQRYIKQLKKETKSNYRGYAVGNTRNAWIQRVQNYGSGDYRATTIIYHLNNMSDEQIRYLFTVTDFLPQLYGSDQWNKQVIDDWLETGLSEIEGVLNES